MSTYDVVITAFNQGDDVREAVDSVFAQTIEPREVIVVDDGSTDDASLCVLQALSREPYVRVIAQPNAGVSAARNRGLAETASDFVVVLDGDDRLRPTFAERALSCLENDAEVLGTSSWLQMFGVATALVKPAGGDATAFLSKNQAPATFMMRRSAWVKSGGYDESMREGFEDWDFFLTLLAEGGRIDIVPEALLEYRTAEKSANMTSMEKRSRLFAGLIDKHEALYRVGYKVALVEMDRGRTAHLRKWEQVAAGECDEATFGDGGMAAVVRIESARATR